MAVAACPNREQLADWLLGLLSEEMTESLADHLDQCPNCQTLVHGLEGVSDDFVAQLSGPRPANQSPLAAELGYLLDQAKAWDPFGGPVAVRPFPPADEGPGTLIGRQLGDYRILEKI